jgi:hypothetical protein
MKFVQVFFSAVASRLLKYPREQSGKGPLGKPVDSFPTQTSRVVVESIVPLWSCSFVRPEPAVFLRCLELADHSAVMRWNIWDVWGHVLTTFRARIASYPGQCGPQRNAHSCAIEWHPFWTSRKILSQWRQEFIDEFHFIPLHWIKILFLFLSQELKWVNPTDFFCAEFNVIIFSNRQLFWVRRGWSSKETCVYIMLQR